MGLTVWLRSTKVKIILFILGQLALFYVIIQLGRSSYKQAVTSKADSCESIFLDMAENREINSSSMNFIIVNKMRANRIREYCADKEKAVTDSFPNYKRLEDVMLSWIWQTSSRHDLFYCATPKCGSTMWKSYILEDMRLTWNVDTHVAASVTLGVESLFKGEKTPTLLQFLRSYRPTNRLIIVRNPWDRLVSAYEDKIIDKQWELHRLCLVGDDYEKPENGVVTFETFIDCLLKSPRDEIWNPHVHPLTALCGLCQMDYNLIVKLEEMDQGEPYLLKKLKFTRTVYVSPRKLKHKTYSEPYKKISENKIRQLQKIYKYDIELFGYPDSPFDSY